jgi:hypothetical protein
MMGESQVHELLAAKRFFIPNRRARLVYCFESGSDKQRWSALRDFEQSVTLDPRYMQSVANRTAETIVQQLEEYGATGTCYLVSNDLHGLDGKTMSLPDGILSAYNSPSGTMVSCIAGQLAYFDGEDENDRWIIRRTDSLIK